MKIFPALICTCAIIWSVSASATEAPSVFFTPAEIEKIETPSAAPPALTDIQLGAILYYGFGRWSIWLDGEHWSPATRRADLQIIEVQPDQVSLQLTYGPAQPIILRPHQTWQATTGRVIEGSPGKP